MEWLPYSKMSKSWSRSFTFTRSSMRGNGFATKSSNFVKVILPD